MRALKVVLGVSAIGLWLGPSWLLGYYFKHRPAAPRPDLGETYRLENHGSAVYLSLHDAVLLYGMMAAAVVCFVLCIAAGLAERRHGAAPETLSQWRDKWRWSNRHPR